MNSLTDRLAVLLREVAEKMPEKFTLWGNDDSTTYDVHGSGGKLVIFDISHPELFSLDTLDAIAEAVGSWFHVYRVNDAWYHGFPGNTEIPGNFSKFPDKRTASLAALCAILSHVLGDTQR